MEARDLELIEKHRKENYELDRLYKEHIKLEEEIEALTNSRVGLSAEEDKRLHQLKKTKLDGRDQMERILESLR